MLATTLGYTHGAAAAAAAAPAAPAAPAAAFAAASPTGMLEEWPLMGQGRPYSANCL